MATTKVIVQIHERTTEIAIDADLQLREIGFISTTNVIRFNDNSGSKHNVWMQDSTGVTFDNGVVLSDSLTVSGMITANGGVTLGAGDDLIGSSTSDITINTNKFTVAGASGNTVVGGTLNVTGIVSTSADFLTNNNQGYFIKDAGGTSRRGITLNTSDQLLMGSATGIAKIRLLTATDIEGDLDVTAGDLTVSAGNLAVGTGTPLQLFHLEDAGSVTAQFKTTGVSAGTVKFQFGSALAVDNDINSIQWNEDAESIEFYDGAQELVDISPTGIDVVQGDIDILAGHLQLKEADATDVSLYFSSTSLTNGAKITWNYNSNALTIGTARAGATVTFNSGNGSDFMTVDSSQNVSMDNGFLSVGGEIRAESGVLRLAEITTPSADTNYGKIYTKTDNKIYFQDGAGTEHEIAFVP